MTFTGVTGAEFGFILNALIKGQERKMSQFFRHIQKQDDFACANYLVDYKWFSFEKPEYRTILEEALEITSDDFRKKIIKRLKWEGQSRLAQWIETIGG